MIGNKTVATFATTLAFGALLATAATARAPLPRYLTPAHPAPSSAPYRASEGGTWVPLLKRYPDTQASADTPQLMTDGTVLVHAACSPRWWKLTPNSAGSYVRGTWSQVASMKTGYQPLYFASEVLTDGRLIVNGGEYNNTAANGCQGVLTNLGSIYDPVKNVWTGVKPPKGWTEIGDAQSVMLPKGQYMLANPFNFEFAIANTNGANVKWTIYNGEGLDGNDEAGWTLLPNGEVLTLSTIFSHNQPTPSALYVPATHTWVNAGAAPSVLVDPNVSEIGPAIVRPDGTVFQIGANSCGGPNCRAHTAIYNVTSGTWSNGPPVPSIKGVYYAIADGPAALEPNGKVLFQASASYSCLANGSPSAFCTPSHFFEFDGSKITRVSDTQTSPSIVSFEGRMLELPTGEILWSADTDDFEVYRETGKPNQAWAPTITSVPSSMTRGTTNSLSGTLLTGVSQGAAYGDDAQMATNFPLVRFTSPKTGQVCYARTHDFSGGVALTKVTSTQFDIPTSCPTGSLDLEVVANGIASKKVTVTLN